MLAIQLRHVQLSTVRDSWHSLLHHVPLCAFEPDSQHNRDQVHTEHERASHLNECAQRPPMGPVEFPHEGLLLHAGLDRCLPSHFD